MHNHDQRRRLQFHISRPFAKSPQKECKTAAFRHYAQCRMRGSTPRDVARVHALSRGSSRLHRSPIRKSAGKAPAGADTIGLRFTQNRLRHPPRPRALRQPPFSLPRTLMRARPERIGGERGSRARRRASAPQHIFGKARPNECEPIARADCSLSLSKRGMGFHVNGGKQKVGARHAMDSES